MTRDTAQSRFQSKRHLQSRNRLVVPFIPRHFVTHVASYIAATTTHTARSREPNGKPDHPIKVYGPNPDTPQNLCMRTTFQRDLTMYPDPNSSTCPPSSLLGIFDCFMADGGFKVDYVECRNPVYKQAQERGGTTVDAFCTCSRNIAEYASVDLIGPGMLY